MCRTNDDPLSYPGRLMRQLSSIVGVLLHAMNRVWYQFSMSNTITSKLIRHNFPWFTFVFLQQSIEESLCGLRISPVLKKHIDDHTILIYCSPEIPLFAINLDKNLINEKCITISLVFFPQPAAYLDPNLLHHRRIDS